MGEFKEVKQPERCISCGKLTYWANDNWKPKPIYCCPEEKCRAEYVSQIQA